MSQAVTTGTWKARLGRVLDLTGRLALPLGVGAVLGYYASDAGMPWLPSFVSALTVLATCALLAIVIGKWLQGTALVETREGIGLRRRVAVLLGLAVLAAGAQLAVYYMRGPSPLTAMSETELDRAWRLDTRQYQIIDDELTALIDRLEGATMFESEHALGAEEEAELLDAWRALYDSAIVLEQTRIFYEDWYRFDPSRAQRRQHVRAFLLSYAAELSLFEKSSRFAALVVANSNAKKFLDVPHAEIGLPADAFSRFRQELHGARDQARVVAGRQYLTFLDTTLHARRDAPGWNADWLWGRIDRNLQMLDDEHLIDTAEISVRADVQGLKRTVRRAWYPAQKEVAELMGDVRVKRVGWYLISDEQYETLRSELEPGDIVITRKNWYLSNLGLPGFWSHAIFYIGDPDTLDDYLDDENVRAWVRETTGRDESFAQMMTERFPVRWARYRRGTDHPYELIEAVGEGVLLNTLPSAGGDYLAALRPRLDKLAKAQAIAEAFTHLDKPYDYDFDFATDHALVCTEVVWRSYRPGPGKTGLDLTLHNVAGRQTLHANEIIHAWADARGTENAQLDFVYFIDVTEDDTQAFVSDEDSLATSYERVKIGLN